MSFGGGKDGASGEVGAQKYRGLDTDFHLVLHKDHSELGVKAVTAVRGGGAWGRGWVGGLRDGGRGLGWRGWGIGMEGKGRDGAIG